MIAFSHTCVSRFLANPHSLRGFLLLFLCLMTAAFAPAGGDTAEEAAFCERLERAKWGSNPMSEDYLALLLDLPSGPPGDVSLVSCWACGLWRMPNSPQAGMGETEEEALLFRRVQCCRALGMQKEAIEDCRRILRWYPRGRLVQHATESIVELLVQQGNHTAVAAFFQGLGMDHRQGLTPTSLYLIAQSLYVLGMDDPAEDLLKQVPPDAAVYPYALYTLAQVLFRKGDADRALLVVGAVRDGPPQADAPPILKDMASLTRARMLYQQKSYAEAIEGFRALGRSPFFLPEALMGMAWCHKALGDLPRSVAYFQAVEESYADGDALTEAHLEMAHVFAQARSYPEAFQVYREILNDLHFRVSQYKKYGGDPEWLNWLAGRFVDRGRDGVTAAVQAPVMNQQADLPREMEPLLEREKYTSPRLKELLGIREALEQIEVLLDRILSPPSPGPIEGRPPSAPYPPMEVPLPYLESSLSALLDLCFALMDTEYRLTYSGTVLGLMTQDERAAFSRDTLSFYRRELETLLLPPEASEGAHATLMRLQGIVRHLPFSLEEKERVLEKLVFAMRNLEAAQSVLEQWAEGAQAVSSSQTQPTRFLLLDNWMTLVRVYLYVRNLDARSPAVFLLDHPSLAEHRPVPPSFSEGTLQRLRQHTDTLWQRFTRLAEREIENIQTRRLEVLEGLLARTQFDYADALVREQERILDRLKESGSEAEAETDPKAGVRERTEDLGREIR
jgi:tetratricopeptide (TPR) repeat protein